MRKESKLARRKKQSRWVAVGWSAAAGLMGAGAGLAAQRGLVNRRRYGPDRFAGEDYGNLFGDKRYEVSSFDGAVLVVEEFGPARTTSGAIFLHGFCLDRTIWHHQMKGMNGRKLVFYDARHHGISRGGAASETTETLARDLEAVIEKSGLKKVVLVGHSMGGMTVLEYCRRHLGELGSRILGVVLVNTTYTDAVKTLVAAEVVAPLERRLRRVINAVLDDPRSSRALRLRGDDLSWALVKMFGFGDGASTTQIEHVQRVLTTFPNPELVKILQGLRSFDMEEALSAIKVPTLIIAGGDDRITTVRASHKMAEEIDGSQLHVLERTGHMTMMERPDEFNELLQAFLDTTLPKPRVRKPRARAAPPAPKKKPPSPKSKKSPT